MDNIGLAGDGCILRLKVCLTVLHCICTVKAIILSAVDQGKISCKKLFGNKQVGIAQFILF